MDYSATNTALWTVVIQLGLIAGALLVALGLRQKLGFIRRSMIGERDRLDLRSDG